MTTLLHCLAWLLVLPVLAFAVEPELNSPAAPAAEELVSTKPQKHVVVMPRGGVPVEEPTLRLNFRGAPMEAVLSYLSDAAGYTVMILRS